MQRLPPEQRRVMHLLFAECLGSKQVATELNISVHTVKKHKLNGIKAIKKKLGVLDLVIIQCWRTYNNHFYKGLLNAAHLFICSFYFGHICFLFASMNASAFLLKEKEPIPKAFGTSTDDISTHPCTRLD